MFKETERKFRITSTIFKALAESVLYINQGYLNTHPERTVRIRIQDDIGVLTVKGIGDETGASRFEWEKDVDVAEARLLMNLCEDHPIEKRRYRVLVGAHWWDVDVFLGANEGLIIAEIELTSIDEEFEIPDWLGEEVTGDPRFYNASLSKRPFETWEEHERDGEVVKMGLQCFAALLGLFAVAFLIIQYHNLMQNCLAVGADWVIATAKSGFAFILPASPSLSAIGSGMALWSICFQMKLIRSGKLTKRLLKYSLGIWMAGFSFAILFLANLLIQSESGATALKLGLIVAAFVGYFGGIVPAAYRDEKCPNL